MNLVIVNRSDIKLKDKHSLTALMEASAGDHLETVKLLLVKGADVNEQTLYGTTALKKTIDYGQADVVELLLEKGADIIMLSTSARDLDPRP